MGKGGTGLSDYDVHDLLWLQQCRISDDSDYKYCPELSACPDDGQDRQLWLSAYAVGAGIIAESGYSVLF